MRIEPVVFAAVVVLIGTASVRGQAPSAAVSELPAAATDAAPVAALPTAVPEIPVSCPVGCISAPLPIPPKAKAAFARISSSGSRKVAIKGADAVPSRPGFKAMLDRIASNGVRVIIVESPDRFARDLAVQLAGHDFLAFVGIVPIGGVAGVRLAGSVSSPMLPVLAGLERLVGQEAGENVLLLVLDRLLVLAWVGALIAQQSLHVVSHPFDPGYLLHGGVE